MKDKVIASLNVQVVDILHLMLIIVTGKGYVILTTTFPHSRHREPMKWAWRSIYLKNKERWIATSPSAPRNDENEDFTFFI